MDFVVNENSWILKFDNLSHFQKVISNKPPTRERHYDALRKKIGMWLTPKLKVFESFITVTNIFSRAT